MALKADAAPKDLVDWLAANPELAATLGLALEKGAKISRKGEFIIAPSNIEEAEDKKMRGYRYKAFPRHVHGWDAEGQPTYKQVENEAEFNAALKDGWFADNDPKNAKKATAKAASTVTHVVKDAASGRTEVETSHPDATAEPKAAKKRKKPAKK
jgi:hypothetical protein